MKNRKLVCLQIHNDYLIPGGETKTAIQIANLLERFGINVIRYYKSNSELKKCGTIKKLAYGFKSLYNKSTVDEINKILGSITVDFVLIHNTMPIISNSVYGIFIKKNIPIIKYVQNYNLVCLNGALDHGSSCENCKKHLLNGVINKCYKNSFLYSFVRYISKKIFDKYYFPYINAFMPNSMFVKRKHMEYGMDGEKMYVMNNFINIKHVNQLKKKSQNYYLYFGRISKEKGIITVLRAFEYLKDLKLVVMGSGEFETELKKYILDHNLKNIIYIGNKTGKDLEQVIANAKCTIVSSEWDEPLPRTIIESYSKGIPVIGTNKGGIPEMIHENKTGYIYQSGCYNELINTIIKFEEIPSTQYAQMCENCIQQIENIYTEEKYFSRFMKCIEDILSP